ncbi:hypothetical protein SLE2022_130680 [Rubroshorea leprosula]
MSTKILLSSSSHGFEKECQEIHDSRGSLSQLLRVLDARSHHECWKIRENYKEIYGEDLILLLQKKKSNENIALVKWLLDPHERDATIAKEALEHGDPNYIALVEIFTGRKSSHFSLIKQVYQSKYRRQLDQDIINIEPPHPFQKILAALAASHKAHHTDVSQHIAKCDAMRLFETGQGRPGTIDEAVVLEIFTKRSVPQLKLTFSCYKHIYGHDYIKAIKKETSGEFEDALKRVIKSICNPPEHYAKSLFLSIKGMTADKSVLTRVMVSRAELDMDEIQKVFKRKYGMELREAICDSIPSGDYRDFLVALSSKTAANTSIGNKE